MSLSYRENNSVYTVIHYGLNPLHLNPLWALPQLSSRTDTAKGTSNLHIGKCNSLFSVLILLDMSVANDSWLRLFFSICAAKASTDYIFLKQSFPGQHFPGFLPHRLLLLCLLFSSLISTQVPQTFVLEPLLGIYSYILGQWFPKCVTQTSSISMT